MRICLSDLPGDICDFLINCEGEGFIPSCSDLYEAFDDATANFYAYELQLPDVREELQDEVDDTLFNPPSQEDEMKDRGLDFKRDFL